MIEAGVYEIGDNIVIGTEYTTCRVCKDNLKKKEKLWENQACDKLHGTFKGKKMLQVGENHVCEDCIKRSYEKIFGEPDENA